MPTPDEKYYDSMNTLLAPVRWAKSLVQTVLLIGLVISIGLAYPVIVYANHEPVTFATFMVPFLTLTTIFTLFYAPAYTVYGGMVFLVGWGAWIINFDAPDRTEALWIWFAFLALGIMQRHIRHRLYDPPNPRQLSFVEQLNEVHDERRKREYDAMSPESENQSVAEADTTAEDADENSNSVALCEKCNKALGLLDLPLGASDEEVNSKKRAFAELLHDDRLGAMSDNARRIAKEQHQSVNEACSHILTCPVRAKSKGNTKGSEPPPARHQSTNEATAGKTEYWSSPASSSGEGGLARQENRHKVPTEQERIDALDATRRKVDETTKEIHDFLEQMKKRKQTSLERP